MACFLYNGGKYSLLAGQHIAKGGVLLPLQADDYLVLRGIAYPIGSKMISPEISSADVTHINGEEPSGRKWYVTPDGSGAKDGSSWENACGIADMLWLMLQVQQGDNIYFLAQFPFFLSENLLQHKIRSLQGDLCLHCGILAQNEELQTYCRGRLKQEHSFLILLLEL